MRFAAFILPLLLLIGCSSTRPDANLPPQYAAAPDSDSVLSAPVYTLAADPAVNRFLAEVADAFLRHDWRALAYTVDAEEYAAQFAFMKSEDRADADVVSQILEETFGLNTVGNTLFPDGLRRADRPFAGLSRLRHVEITAVDASGEIRQVDGQVSLADRTKRSLSFFVTNQDGAWRVVVPQG
ncbi:MAG: hypothetical protein HKN04_02680 [Rhodothermaceae bacterium]|nr:hypothetical protein [Rhodothermaceae bacterium]